MANKKTEVFKKKRTMYFEEELFEDFSKLCELHKKSPSFVLNAYMKKVVKEYKSKIEQA